MCGSKYIPAAEELVEAPFAFAVSVVGLALVSFLLSVSNVKIFCF